MDPISCCITLWEIVEPDANVFYAYKVYHTIDEKNSRIAKYGGEHKKTNNYNTSGTFMSKTNIHACDCNIKE